jgi:uncharacterized protein (DUF608 family)
VNSNCCIPSKSNTNARRGLTRREAVKFLGLGAAALTSRLTLMAGPFQPGDFESLVPADKKLDPQWVKSLFARGSREVYRGTDLEKIGMPVGGIGTGQLYLGGDGRLWHWDIFNQFVRTGAEHYAHPLKAESPLTQGFALKVRTGGKTEVRPLDRTGFPDVSFCGEYPIGYIDYRDPALPVALSLEAFSPFIPLEAEDSGLPATVMHFTVKNTSAAPVEAEFSGWLENAVALKSSAYWPLVRRNRVVREDGWLLLDCRAEPAPVPSARPAIVFADFEGETYGAWKTEGEAFGPGPARGPGAANQKLSGFQGKGLVNSFRGSDRPRGKLTSPDFIIERNWIVLLVGGGNHAGETCVNLLVGGKIVREARGKNRDVLEWTNWDVRDFAGQSARIEIVDQHEGGWGHIDVDQIEFRDVPRAAAASLAEEGDWGTMSLALLDSGAADAGLAAVAAEKIAESSFGPAATGATERTQSPDQKLIGALRRPMTLAPGQSATATFVLAWHFPNDRIERLKTTSRRRYAARFDSAAAVVRHVARNFATLAARTRRWHDTWYDSTLPYWFLDRTFLNTSILATSTSHWFEDNRFYGWEGVGCCAGTCTHVWHYAHAMGRLFPQLERSLREMTDYGVGFDADTGRIRFRAEHNNHWAVDGQAGTILRVYREHQMSGDDAFLRRLWPRVKKSLEYMIATDEGADGILDGAQHNTLDADWWGQVAWLSGLYVSALRAGEEMAREVGDTTFGQQCREIAARGHRAICDRLFNGEYFIQVGDAAHAKTVGSYDSCEIDQVFGQSWAWQVALGRVLDEDKVKAALRSLWRYNFTPDVGPYRKVHEKGRWYAMAGEAGLLMATWPKGEAKRQTGGYDYYFNECMNGFEYQVAGHMLWEGLVLEGMAITRAVHDRYHPARRNPWNEVECGDHYARSMASYGVFLASCGYEYHGPKSHLGFAPRLTPENFRAPFTTAAGWGTFRQTIRDGRQEAQVLLRFGQLRLRSLALATSTTSPKVEVRLNAKLLKAVAARDGQRLVLTLQEAATLRENDTLAVVLG